MNEGLTFYCIICGREFRPATPETVICPSCGGPPEAPTPQQPQATVLMDALPAIPTPPTKPAHPPAEILSAGAEAEAYFCIICGREFCPADPDIAICPACGGPPEAPTPKSIGPVPMAKYLCIVCGREFRPADPDIAICPACGGPPEAIEEETPAVSTRSFAAEADVPLKWNEGDLILDLYQVKGALGAGGMGAVYRVHHTRWNIDLAVKTPLPEALERAGGAEGFEREAEAWVKLGLHPHIVSCYYVRRLGRVPRVFAECVEGWSLKDWIRDGRLYVGGEGEALKRILDLAIQFAWGLGYAHEQGLVHQDVKPANALLTPEGVLKVTDFGLVGAKGYTQAYAAPEQVLGKEVDARADLWGWGLSVLEMFAGECHWVDGTVAATVLENYLGELPGGLPRMPEGVVALLRECFQNDPNQRPPDMDAVAERLMAVYQQELGKPYPREKPKALALRADGLNNRAVSFLDLGREEEAVKCWQEALEADPAHLEANFNYGYYRWHRAELLGSEFLTQMQQLESTHGQDAEYWRLLGWVYLEQGYVEEVEEILQKRGVQDEALECAHRDPNRPVGREVCRFGGDTGFMKSVAFSPDGRYALSGSVDGTVRLWETATGREVRRFGGHTDYVYFVAFSPDGQYVLSGSRGFDGTVRLWEVESGREVRRFEGQADIWSLAISPNGRHALSGRDDNTVRLWEVTSGREVRQLKGHTDDVSAVAFSLDGRYALSGSYDKTVRLWDLATGHEMRQMEGHTGYVFSVAFLPDGGYALSGSGDKTVRLWEVTSGREVRRMEGHTSDVNSVAISPDGRYVLSGSGDKTIRLWEVTSGREIRCFEGHSGPVEAVSFSPDGRYALSGSRDGTVRLWEVQYPSFRLVTAHPFPALARARGVAHLAAEQVRAAELIQQARQHLTQSRFQEAHQTLRQAQALPGWERAAEVLVLLAECGWQGGGWRVGLRDAWFVRCFEGHTGKITSVTFSPDGRYVLSGSEDRTVRLWEVVSGQEVRCFEGDMGWVYSVAFSPDGRCALLGSHDGTVRLLDVETGRETCRLFKRYTGLQSVAFSPDGRYALSGSVDGTVRLWETVTGREVCHFECMSAQLNSVAFSPDGRYVLAGGGQDRIVLLWEIAAGREVRRFEGHTSGVNSVAFSPDGCYALSGSNDKTLRLWEVASGREVRCFEGHSGPVEAVSFSPDGRYALSGSDDDTVRLWEVTSGREVRRLKGHADDVSAVAFSPNGRYALAGSWDKTLRLWEFDWEWEFPAPADWDEGARPYLEIFLTLHTPCGPDGISRVGKSQWAEEDFQQLVRELGVRGYGWLRPEGVRWELEKMARERE